MNPRRILVVDPSKELSSLLQYTVRESEFFLELSGSPVAVLHKIREGNNFLLLWENQKNPDPRPVVRILREAQKASLPMLLLSSWAIPEEHRQKISVLLSVLEPPLYPFRILREFMLFEAIEETVYVYRNPQRRLKGLHFWFLDQTGGKGSETLKILREFTQENGIRMLASEHEETLFPLMESQGNGILFIYAQDLEQARTILLKAKGKIQRGGVVPLLPEEMCEPKALYFLLLGDPLTFLPWQFTPSDLDSFSSFLRQHF